MIYNLEDSRLLLGCLLNNPQFLNNSKFELNKNDFEPVLFHQWLFRIILYCAKNGMKTLDVIDIYTIAEKHKEVMEIFEENDAQDFIITFKDLGKSENIEYYYEQVKKMSVLRAYDEYGWDISDFYNIEYDKNLSNNYSLQDIINHFESIQSSIRKEFAVHKNIEEKQAGKDFFEIKEQLKETPMFGAHLISECINTPTRGWVKGQVATFSIPSGMGKTTLGISNMVKVCCPELWNFETKQYENNPCYQGESGLYIQFEMDNETEVEPKFISYISGVPTYHIMNGKYEDDEEERVEYAIDILENKSSVYLVTMPNYTLSLIDTYIKDYALNYKVGYVVFDYISLNSSVVKEVSGQNTNQTRMDNVLADISNKLKELAQTYKVAILTFTQISRNLKDQTFLDSDCISGAKAIENKTDIGGVINELRKSEQIICTSMLENSGKMGKPNRVLHLYKSRFNGEKEQKLKIYFYLDLSTGRIIDYFTTTKLDHPYNLTKTKLLGLKQDLNNDEF